MTPPAVPPPTAVALVTGLRAGHHADHEALHPDARVRDLEDQVIRLKAMIERYERDAAYHAETNRQRQDRPGSGR
jgi:hypothetical protein